MQGHNSPQLIAIFSLELFSNRGEKQAPAQITAGPCSILGGQIEGTFHMQARIGVRTCRNNPAEHVICLRTLL